MKHLRLENFRCFSELDINFRPGVNLLIGDNASGKTSLLKACKYALNAFFAGFSDGNTNWITLRDEDFRREVYSDWTAPEQPIRIYFTPSPAHYDGLPATQDSEDLYLAKNSSKNSRTLITGFRSFIQYAKELKSTYWDKEEHQCRPLPLFAAFSTEDIHSSRSIRPELFTRYNAQPTFGYHECLNGHGLFSYWKRRLLVLDEGKKGQLERDIFRKAILSALGEGGCGIIADVEIRAIIKKIIFTFADKREAADDILPDGYMRLINIVTDLACRCVLLNGALYGEKCLVLTRGTVLIDEIDQHLHPTLQSTVLRSLRRTFPGLQFIVATHAPLVMSSIQNDEHSCVWLLTHTETDGYQIRRKNTYGMDVAAITQDILSVPPRDREVAEELSSLFTLLKERHYAQAEQLLLTMREKYTDTISELTRAETMLHLSNRSRS